MKPKLSTSGTALLLTMLGASGGSEVSGGVDLDTTAHFEGVILGQTSITLRTGASIDGRLLAQTAVNIDGSAVVAPAL